MSTKSNQEASTHVPDQITLMHCLKLDAERCLARWKDVRAPPVPANKTPHHGISRALLLSILNEALEIIGDDQFLDDEE